MGAAEKELRRAGHTLALGAPMKRRAKTRLNRVGKVKRLKTKKQRGAVKEQRGKVRSWD